MSIDNDIKRARAFLDGNFVNRKVSYRHIDDQKLLIIKNLLKIEEMQDEIILGHFVDRPDHLLDSLKTQVVSLFKSIIDLHAAYHDFQQSEMKRFQEIREFVVLCVTTTQKISESQVSDLDRRMKSTFMNILIEMRQLLADYKRERKYEAKHHGSSMWKTHFYDDITAVLPIDKFFPKEYNVEVPRELWLEGMKAMDSVLLSSSISDAFRTRTNTDIQELNDLMVLQQAYLSTWCAKEDFKIICSLVDTYHTDSFLSMYR